MTAIFLPGGPAPAFFDDAACTGVDPDLFFPERGASTKEAKAVCEACPAVAACLEYALTQQEKFGIWGGKSERERRVMRRVRREHLRISAGNWSPSERSVYAALTDVPQTVVEVASASGRAVSTVQTALGFMLSTGAAVRTGGHGPGYLWAVGGPL